MYKVYILGIDKIYDEFINNFRYEELKGNIEIRGIIALDVHDATPIQIDTYPVISLNEVTSIEYDYIVTLTEDDFITCKEQKIFQLEKLIKARVFKLPYFDFAEYIKIKENVPTIVSNHCWGGLIYHLLALEFQSPLINMFIHPDEYITLLKDFSNIMKQELTFVRMEKIGDKEFPVGEIGGIKLYMNHYRSFSEAKEKWDNRVKRIKYDNLFVQMYMDETIPELVHEFTQVNYERKILFIPSYMEGEEVCSMPEFSETKLSEQYNNYFWKYVNSMGRPWQGLQSCNIFNILLEKDVKKRVFYRKGMDNAKVNFDNCAGV